MRERKLRSNHCDWRWGHSVWRKKEIIFFFPQKIKHMVFVLSSRKPTQGHDGAQQECVAFPFIFFSSTDLGVLQLVVTMTNFYCRSLCGDKLMKVTWDTGFSVSKCLLLWISSHIQLLKGPKKAIICLITFRQTNQIGSCQFSHGAKVQGFLLVALALGHSPVHQKNAFSDGLFMF